MKLLEGIFFFFSKKEFNLGKIGIRKAEKQIRENEETQRLLTAGSSYAPREWWDKERMCLC